MPVPISSYDDLTARWLTERLEANGHLRAGVVRSVEIAGRGQTETTAYATLHVAYSPSVLTTAPNRLFVKFTRPDIDAGWLTRHNEKEHTFYARAFGDPSLPTVSYLDMQTSPNHWQSRMPIVPYYDMARYEQTGRAHLILADMTATHAQTRNLPRPLPPEILATAFRALARVHAAWWERPALRTFPNAPNRDYDRSDARWTEIKEGCGPALVDALTPIWSQFTTDPLWETLVANARMRESLTLTHRDLGLQNFLYPRDLERDEAILVDWGYYAVCDPFEEINELFVVNFSVDERKAVEQEMLREYFAAFQEHGVRSYSWEQFIDSYHRSLIGCLVEMLGGWGVDAENIAEVLAAFQGIGGMTRVRELL